MELKLGDYNTLSVLRETPFAYILTNGEDEVFLHKNQATDTLNPADDVKVFLYYDNQKRVTATMNMPILDQINPNFAKVVGVHRKLGIFLDIGLRKDLLLSIDDLPPLLEEWPKENDEIFVKIKVSANQLTAKRINRFDIQDYLIPTEPLNEGDEVEVIKIYQAEEGAVFITREGHRIFIYGKHMRQKYRLGETATMTITIVKDNFSYNATMIEQKELMLEDDASILLEYLYTHDGVMPFTDKSSPNAIKDTFHMSKSAFKRALGTLYKNQQVILEKDQTRLKEVE
ncbi:MAG: DNA-binding protein [Candidatus Izimaplasma sp.]|nr:DNA-binding protein [Candidatus Izimaplasma bacterium]